MIKKLFKKPFIQVLVPAMEKEEPKNFIKVEQLMSLIKDDKFRQEILKKYDCSEDSIIYIKNIDIAFKYVRYITEKYEYLNLTGDNSSVNTFLKKNKSDDSEKLFFELDSLYDEERVMHDKIFAEAIYESPAMLYNDRKLSPYINFLKNQNKNLKISTSDRNELIKVIDDSWKRYYQRSSDSLKPRLFRFLKDSKNNYYLRSITSESYKEYGVAFCFVISMLALHELMQKDKGTNFRISSLALNESKIDMVVTDGKVEFSETINSYLSSSILISNNDLGNKSLSFKHSLEVQEKEESGNVFFIFPRVESKNIDYKMSSRHTDNINTVLSMFDSLPEVINYSNEFIKAFEGFVTSKTPDELRAKIEEKIKGPNSPFRGIKQIEDLFSRSTSQHINNLNQLIHICKQAEMLDIDFDLKSKLRYIISDVILYGKHY